MHKNLEKVGLKMLKAEKKRENILKNLLGHTILVLCDNIELKEVCKVCGTTIY